MALKIFDRVLEVTTSTGTSDVLLAGALAGFQAFSAVFSDGDQMPYFLAGTNTHVWETGIATYHTSTNSLSRSTVKANSSHTTSPLNLASDTYNIGVDIAAYLAQIGIDIYNLPSNSVLQWNGTDVVAGTAPSGWSGVSGAAQSGWSGVSGNVGPSGWSGVSGRFQSGWSGVSGSFQSGWSGISGNFQSGWSGVSGVSNSGWSGVSGTSNSGWSGISGTGPSGWSGVSGNFQSGWSGVSGNFQSGWSGVSGRSGWSGVSGTSNSGWSGISGTGPSGWSGVSGNFQSGWSGISGNFQSGWSGVSGTFQSGWSGISGVGPSGWSGISGTGPSGWSGISGNFQSGWSGVSGNFQSGWSGISGLVGPATFTLDGSFFNGTSSQTVFCWQAPFACTVTNVKGYRNGGTGATINAADGTNNFLSSDLSLVSADAWADGGAVQNTAIAAGDKVALKFQSFAGTPSYVTIQINLTKP